MKLSFYSLFILLLIFLFSSPVHAQRPDSIFAGLRAKIGIIQDSIPPPVVFMHIDKSVYPVTEDIWFSAYILNQVDFSACHTLYVTLINDMTLKTVSSQRFILDAGISSGNILIPDSLKGGAYSLIAYTNKDLEKPAHHFFRQPIIIIGGKKPPFELQFVYPPAEKIINDTVMIACKVITSYGGIAAGGKINYTLYSGDKEIRNASAKLDAFGEVKVPLSLQNLTAFPELRGTVMRDKDTMIFRSSVAGASEFAIADFYPEAGRLLDGVATNIAFNIRSTNGRGIALQAGIYKNDTLLQLVESDKYGMGSFSFVPAAADRYQLKPVSGTAGNLVILQKFPAVASAGYSINMNSGIATDSLRFYLSTPVADADCMIMVHTNSEVFWELMVKVKSRLGRLVLPVEGWSKGSATISVFSAKGELVAQKAVMIGMPAVTRVELRTDSLKYHPRSKIKVSLVVLDSDGKPLHGLLSAAVVLKKTLNNSSVEIDSYHYAGYYSGQRLPITENILENPAGKTSQLLMRLSPATVPAMNIKQSAWDGEVTMRDKKLKKPVEVLVTGTSVNILKTDETGKLLIPYDLLRGPSQSKVLIAVIDKRAQYHSIHIPEKDKDLNDLLAARYVSQPFIMKDELSAREKEEIRLLQGQELATVVVKGRTQGEFISGSNDCLDYICSYKILNCSNHLRGTMGTRAATDGETYIVNGVPTVYHCKPIMPKHIASINATWDSYQFPPMNPADSTIPPEILKRTTLYWEPHIRTGDDGKAVFSFYANDLKGNFVVRIQGISANGPVTGYAEFSIAD